MFYEAVLANWFSNGKQPNGMIIRLQGFDRGVFGGNFHTHNMLTLPPGLDVVCYSNGLDYVRGWRYAFAQAQAGRVVMSVDATHLLNLRHMLDGDDSWRRPYPAAGEVMTFEQVGPMSCLETELVWLIELMCPPSSFVSNSSPSVTSIQPGSCLCTILSLNLTDCRSSSMVTATG